MARTLQSSVFIADLVLSLVVHVRAHHLCFLQQKIPAFLLILFCKENSNRLKAAKMLFYQAAHILKISLLSENTQNLQCSQEPACRSQKIARRFWKF
jgi:hypothetical protein